MSHSTVPSTFFKAKFFKAKYSNAVDLRSQYFKTFSSVISFSLMGALLIAPSAAQSQVDDQSLRRSSSNILMEEVTVTARKREESIQDVPLSITALNADQLEVLKIRDLTNLAVTMPNVALDDIGTSRGVANFSIRGLGINSSIPSIDPTVGVFVDGVYLGLNNGIIFDTFDLDSIEVLRGPQGTLFGRNVTGGAVLLNTANPSDEFEAKVRVALDGGSRNGLNNRYIQAVAGGPLNDEFAAKVSVHFNDDRGWFENSFDGDEFGLIEQIMVRPLLVYSPSDSLEVITRFEYSKTSGDGPAAQSHTSGSGIDGAIVNFDRDSFDFSIDERGFQKSEAKFLTSEINWNVDFGQGTVTNIFGWRDYSQSNNADIDAQPAHFFHAPAWLDAEQYSNELRYTGTFNDRTTVTAGLFYFTNDLSYHERRLLLGGALTQDGGGDYEVTTKAVFASVDHAVTDRLTLTIGARFTDEEKDVQIASLIANVNSPCLVTEGTCPFDFTDDASWDSTSPKIGAAYQLDDDSNVYGHWTKGYRSGGYNLRNTSGDLVNNGPGPFNQETVETFELGYKTQLGDRGWINAAIFNSKIEDMQREVNLADPVSVVVQIIKNTADATINGAEIDGGYSLTDSVFLSASIGWIDDEYDKVLFDISGDGTIDDLDLALELPRAADLTYNVSLSRDDNIGGWAVSSRISFSHRDESFYLDNNLGIVNEQDILDAGIDLYSGDGHWVVGIYGKNLTDEVKHGGDTQLPAMVGPAALGGTFSPLAKGRVMGAEVTYNF